jgi:protein subunit release factor B
MEELGIFETDLVERFIRGSGHGGQKINKTSSCVYLQHVPTGLEVKCQAERSRAMNRFIARRELCDQLEEIQLGEKSARRQEMEKIRRQKRRRSRRQRQRDVGLKRQHGEKKSLRRKPGVND